MTAAQFASALITGWLAWLWFVNLYAAGEAAIGQDVPMRTWVEIWSILGAAAVIRCGQGFVSQRASWQWRLLAVAYPMLRLPILPVGVFLFALFWIAAWAGKSVRSFTTSAGVDADAR